MFVPPPPSITYESLVLFSKSSVQFQDAVFSTEDTDVFWLSGVNPSPNMTLLKLRPAMQGRPEDGDSWDPSISL